MKASRTLALLLISAALSACALLPKHYAVALLPKHHPVTKITPVSTPLASADRPDDSSYESAVRAINARSYAEALDQLEIARERDPNDIRVLNAFGVVYDKLGRFDLSAHYYELAAVIDPASWIIKQNLAYSGRLQRAAHRDSEPALAAAPPDAAPAGRLVRIAPGVARLDGPIGAPPILRLARGITGHPLALVDASGGQGVEPVRVRLTRLGWTAPRLAEATAPRQPYSEIIYPARARVVALALARTLPQRVNMAVCSDGCEGVRLVLGGDSLAWTHRSVRDGVHRA